jgi:hypothetical protein
MLLCVYACEQAIKAAYERNHGMSLQRAIEKECGYVLIPTHRSSEQRILQLHC